MFDTPIHIIDFEGSHRSGVLEWGVVTLEEGCIVDARSRLCGNRSNISNAELAQHGISETLIRNLEPFEVDRATFMNYRQTGVLCAHHAVVEDGFLRSTWAFPRASKDFSNSNTDKLVASWGPWLDTLQIYRRLYPKLESYKLDALVLFFELDSELKALSQFYCEESRSQFHCALYDALASGLLLKRLFSLKELVDLSLNQLFILSSGSNDEFEKRSQQELW